MTFCSLQIFCFLLFSSLEGRYVTDESVRWPQPRTHHVSLNPTEIFYQIENSGNTKSGSTEVDGVGLRHAVEIERAAVTVKLEVKSGATKTNANKEIDAKVEIKLDLEGEPEAEMKTGATRVLTKRDASDYKVKTYKVQLTYKNSQPYAPVSIGSKEYQVLVDTGSAKTLISNRLFEQLKTDRQRMTFSSVRQHCDTTDGGVVMPINFVANIPFEISRFPVTFPFFVADGLETDMLFGYDSMVQTSAVLDFSNNLFTSNPPKQGCRTLMEKVASSCCMMVPFVDASSKPHEVKFVRGKPVTVLPVTIGVTKFEALLDSATAVSLISQRFVTILKGNGLVEKTEKASETIAINAQKTQLTEKAYIPLKIGGSSLTIPFLVARDVPVDLIVGYDFMSATKAVFDYKTGGLIFTAKPSSTESSKPK